MDGPIVDPPIDIELNANQTFHLEHLKNQTLTGELKYTLIRECLKRQSLFRLFNKHSKLQVRIFLT